MLDEDPLSLRDGDGENVLYGETGLSRSGVRDVLLIVPNSELVGDEGLLLDADDAGHKGIPIESLHCSKWCSNVMKVAKSNFCNNN